MGTTRTWIAATAAVLAIATPFIGAAEAGSDRNRNGHYIELRNDDVRLVASRRDDRRYRHQDHRFDGYGRIRTPRINRRIRNQLRRIARGRDRGRLSRFSAIRLRGRVFAIRSALQFAKLDGHVSRRERHRLMDMLDANSNRIRRHARFGNRRFY